MPGYLSDYPGGRQPDPDIIVTKLNPQERRLRRSASAYEVEKVQTGVVRPHLWLLPWQICYAQKEAGQRCYQHPDPATPLRRFPLSEQPKEGQPVADGTAGNA